VVSAFRELDELGCILWNDAKRAEAHLHDDTARRQFVRAVFAYIEGLVYRLKRVIITGHEAGRYDLLPSDLALLREETYELDDKGNPQVRPAHLSTTRNMRFTFAQYEKAWGGSFTLEVDTQGWGTLRSATAIRNRLMHPKSVADLEVSQDEANTVQVCFEWFTAEFCRLLESCPPPKPGDQSSPDPLGGFFKRGAKFKAK